MYAPVLVVVGQLHVEGDRGFIPQGLSGVAFNVRNCEYSQAEVAGSDDGSFVWHDDVNVFEPSR